METVSDRERIERDLRDAAVSDGLQEPNQVGSADVKLTDALPRSAGGSSKDGTFFLTEELLFYLNDERNVSEKVAKRNKPKGLRRKCAKGDDAEAWRLVGSILAEKNVELSIRSSEDCCADLVGALVGDWEALSDAKPWVGSTSDRATHIGKVRQTLLSSVRNLLPRLIAKKVCSNSSKDATAIPRSSSSSLPVEDLELLARSLEKRVATTVRLDAEDVSSFVDIAKLEAKFESHAAIGMQLLAQNARLRRVAAADKMCASHLENVASDLSSVRDSLASRLERCSSLVTATTTAAHNPKMLLRTAVHAADLTMTDHEGAFHELYAERLRTAAARTEAIGKLEVEREKIQELADVLAAELNEACQGSVKTWCMNQASLVKQDKVRAMTRELFREFHEDPERFLKRVHSAQKGACGMLETYT